MEGGVVVVLITAPRGKGAEIARKLLEARLAACANITSVHSIYWWKGKLEEDEEDLIILKTRVENLEKLVEEVRKVHPYEVPEVIAIPVIAGLREYLEWVRREAVKR